MTADELTAALRACAAGLYPLEAGVALLTAEGTFLRRPDFTSRFITVGTSISDGTTPMADIDWDAAITALHADEIPCSGGERRILMLSASLAGGIPVDLRDAAPGLDDRNIQRLVKAILHASGRRVPPTLPCLAGTRRRRPAQVLRSPAVTSTPGYPREWAAYHECGHAAAFWNLGLPFEYVTLSMPSHLQPLRTGTVSTVNEKRLYSVAGIIADYQHRGLIMKDAQISILLTGGAGQYELTDPSTRLAVMRPSRAKAVGPGEDLQELAEVATAEGWPVEYCASIWRDCELYVKGLAPAIDAIARRLLMTETMTPAEVSAVAGPAMRNKPGPVVPDWAVKKSPPK